MTVDLVVGCVPVNEQVSPPVSSKLYCLQRQEASPGVLSRSLVT